MNESKKKKLFLSLKSKNFSNNILSNDEFNDNCILKNKCPFYKKYMKFKNQIIAFISSQEKLKLVNQSLHMALAEKNKIYKEVKNENNYLKGIIYNLTGIKFSEFSFGNSMSHVDNSEYLDQTELLMNTNPKTNRILNTETGKINTKFYDKIKIDISGYKRNNLFSYTKNTNKYKPNKTEGLLKASTKHNSTNSNILPHSEIDEIYCKDNIKKREFSKNSERPSSILKKHLDFSKNKLIDGSFSPNEYYDLINNFTKKQKFQSRKTKEINSSYLSLDVNLLELLNNNTALNKLEYFAKNDENFIKTCKTGKNDTLFKYCDYINHLLTEYKEIIKVCSRMKDLIKSAINLIESIISNDSSKRFIEITCDILKCDRASLFIYDKISDKLILVTAEGLNRAQIKLDKKKGIVGNCFTDCQIIRIEDAYLDERFNKEIDKQTNYRTKSILCYPLIDKNGECIGVIEAINKLDNSVFTDEDQEVLKILSQEAASIFKSISYHDNNKYLVVTLYSIIDFSIKIQFVDDIHEFCRIMEDTVLNVFNCLETAIYFLKDGHLIRYFKNKEYKTYDINFGIIGKSIRMKEIIGIKNIKNSKEHNSLIDLLTSDGLLTFPVLAKKTKEVCAVIQVPFIGEINQYGKPKEVTLTIIKKLSKCIKYWIFKNKIE